MGSVLRHDGAKFESSATTPRRTFGFPVRTFHAALDRVLVAVVDVVGATGLVEEDVHLRPDLLLLRERL